MKTFPCGCSLTRESWQLCRQHYDAKEGRLDAYLDAIQRLESLFIAGPMLLEACKAAYEQSADRRYDPPLLGRPITDKLRAAIAAAEPGEQTNG